MTSAPRLLAATLERMIGRRQMVRASRFLLNYARRDGPNQISSNGERVVQRAALAAAADRAVVFDVGANLGQWSSSLIGQNTRGLDLHVFEPAGECMRSLEHSLASTELLEVFLNQQAVSDIDGEATLYKPHEFAGSSSLHSTTLPCDAVGLRESVHTCTLDTYCRDHDIFHIDLLKIDAEGHDFSVLRGAAGLLERRAIDLIQFEYNYRWISSRHYLKDVFDLASPWGYDVGKVTGKGIEWYPAWSSQLETLIEGNYVAARSDYAGSLPSISWWAEADRVGHSPT